MRRRRHCHNNRQDAARSFYERHNNATTKITSAVVEPTPVSVHGNDRSGSSSRRRTTYGDVDIDEKSSTGSVWGYGQQRRQRKEYKSDDSYRVHRRSIVSTTMILMVRKIVSILGSLISTIRVVVVSVLLWHRRRMDATDACVSCLRRFSSLRSTHRRKTCANCANDFCRACLNKQHELFDGKPTTTTTTSILTDENDDEKKKKRGTVCSYCFFTLCARHCRDAACIARLPTKELKAFLRRKQVCSRTALEKNDLVELIRSWSAELDREARRAAAMDKKENNNKDDDDDVEAGNSKSIHSTHQVGAAGRERQHSTSYSASSAHLTMNAADINNSNRDTANHYYDYSKLSVVELKHFLHSRNIDSSGCVEKSDLIHLLVNNNLT